MTEDKKFALFEFEDHSMEVDPLEWEWQRPAWTGNYKVCKGLSNETDKESGRGFRRKMTKMTGLYVSCV